MAQWDDVTKISASDRGSSDHFGHSVAVSGDVAVIGSHEDDDCGSDSGSAYVFCYDGTSWYEEQKLLASDGAAQDEFGRSVAIFGDIAGGWISLYDDDNGS